MKQSDNWGIEWLVATLAPWAVSPHPNFRSGDSNGPARLALVSEMRDTASERGSSLSASTGSTWADLLVRHAGGSLQTGMQETSAQSLLGLSAESDMPPAARAAAAIYGSAAMCELEFHEVAVSVLSNLAEELAQRNQEPTDFLASQRLVVSAIYLHLVTRLIESCRFAEARQVIEITFEWLPRLDDTNLEVFTTSPGISWSAATVQRDLLRSLKNHALALKSHLEYFGGDTWVRVVRGRSSWVDMRARLLSAARDEIILRDAFERRIDANSNSQHFGRVTAEVAGYRALTIAELSGDLGAMRSEREKLGKVLLLERSSDEERVREAIRLLRQGRATKALQSAIAWIRGQGPSGSLVTDALVVIDRVQREGWCTEQDLLVLEGASDFLSPAQRDQAISATLVFVETPQISGQLAWTSWERVWKTVARLVPASSSHRKIERLAFDYINSASDLSQPIANTLSRLISVIDWGQIADEETKRWAGWLEGAERNSDVEILLNSVEEIVQGSSRPAAEKTGLDRAAFFADEGLVDTDTTETIEQVASELRSFLRTEAEQASNGIVSIGGYQGANVAVAFALRFPDSGIWLDIANHLLNPQVDAGLKNLAVDRLAERAADLPISFVNRVKDEIGSLIQSDRNKSFFSQSGSSVFAEAIRLAAALGALSNAELLETVLHLASSGVKDRVQAAKTIPFCILRTDGTWGHALLLQLSHDPDPSVRAAAGHGLIRSLGVSSDLTEAIHARVITMLRSDGIGASLAVLQAIIRSIPRNRSEVEPFLAEVAILAGKESNYLTQRAAKACLERLGNAEG